MGDGGRVARRALGVAAGAAAVLLAVLALGLPSVPAASAAAAPRVDVMVAGRSGILLAPTRVRAGATMIRASGRRCAVGAGTPVAALAAADRAGGPSFRTRDEGSCSRRARDAGGLFVFKVGRERNRGDDGWAYKVGRRAGTTGGADPSGPFGTGRRLRSGQRVVWFWCTLSRATESCQPTLEAVPAVARVAPGGALRVVVRAYDDAGRGRPAAGATVRLGPATAVARADGTAVLTAPTAAGRLGLTATGAGVVPAFPTEVVVG